MNNLKVNIQDLQAELRHTKKEATRRVRSVRSFWKDKIYAEASRSGIMLKKAMQKM